jgi:hypothetical protein
MTDNESSPWSEGAQWQAEACWLRRWGWLFPVLGALCGLWWASSGWALLALNPDLRVPLAVAATKTSFFVCIGIGTALPLLWAAGLRLSRFLMAGRSPFYGPLLAALALVALLDGGSRTYLAQDALWGAVGVRVGRDYFMSELVTLRRYCLDQHTVGHQRGGTILAGSSQMIYAVDPEFVREKTSRPVYRRALAGMFALEACLAQDYLVVPGAKSVVLLASGLDTGARRSLEANWMRPLATWRGTGDLIACLDAGGRLRWWRQLTDLAAGSSSELWRERDYVRHLLFNLAGITTGAQPILRGNSDLEKQRRDYAELGQHEDLVEAGMKAYQRVLRRFVAEGYEVIVIEGETNPREANEFTRKLDARTRAMVEQLAKELPLAYVPRADQQPRVLPGDWLDVLHVNEAGRAKMSQVVSDALTRAPVTKNPH